MVATQVRSSRTGPPDGTPATAGGVSAGAGVATAASAAVGVVAAAAPWNCCTKRVTRRQSRNAAGGCGCGSLS